MKTHYCRIFRLAHVPSPVIKFDLKDFPWFQVVTVSANSGFVRAAQGQGINLAVIIHESRALTEGKMGSAAAVSESD